MICLVTQVSSLPGFVAPIFTMGWDQINPYSINNQIKSISSELKNVKTQLEKIEHTVIFGNDIKTIEYLIEIYNDKVNASDEEKGKWAETALSYGSDGFQKTLSSMEKFMEGTSRILAEGSIFQIIANDEDYDANVCLNIEAAWEYLGGVWTLGHAVWVQAYKIKHKNDYSTFATQKKDAAMSKMEDFSRVKDLAYPDHCHCFLKGYYYAELDFVLNLRIPTNATSSMKCQTMCYQDRDCKAFTYIQSTEKCYKHANKENEIEVDEDTTKSFEAEDIISGPRICPKHFSFCCRLGFGISVFIVVLIVFASLFCCCCVLGVCCFD